MKKAITFALLSVFFISQLGYYLLYTCKQQMIRENVERELIKKIPLSACERFVEAHHSNIIWEEKDKEFSIDGQLYDVVSIKTENQTKVLYCVNDKKEEELVKNLVNSVNNSQKNRDSNHQLKWQQPDLILTLNDDSPTSIHHSLNYTSFNESLTFSFCEITSPPPRS